MISPSFGFKKRDYIRLTATGAGMIGRSFLEIGKIALGILVMWLIGVYGIVAFVPNKIVIILKNTIKNG